MSKIITSEQFELITADLKSAIRGLILMFSVTSAIFLVGFLEKYIDNPSIVIDWKATLAAYIGAISVSFATFGVNLLKKFIQTNEYIK